jgi:hypothetical protein
MANEKQYRANWQIAGLTKKDLAAGDVIKLSEDDAAHLVKLGALSLADAEVAAEPVLGGAEPDRG